MTSLTSNNYLGRAPIEAGIQSFAKQFHEGSRILDIGCGEKPYQHFFSGTYVGIDHEPGTKADIVCDSTSIPLPDSSFDGIVATQVLEHTADVPGTLREILRLLKPDGKCFISVPMTVRVHGEPTKKGEYDTWYVDYWRFTKYGLLLLCKDFRVESIKETSGYVGTMMQMTNYFFSSFGIPYVFIPLYFINNIFGKVIDDLVYWICSINNPTLRKAYQLIYLGLPLNYCLVIQKNR